MKFILLFLPFIISCASCQLIKDQAQAPVDLNQDRVIMKIGDNTEVGIQGVTSNDAPLQVQASGPSTMTLRGMNECGFVFSESIKDTGWMNVDLSQLPSKDFCLYSIQVRTNGFDAPAIGHLLVQKLSDPNVKPLSTQVNHIARSGVNWVQIEATSGSSIQSDSPYAGGIYESHDIIIWLGGHSGNLYITGCGTQPDVIPYTKSNFITVTVEHLYRQFKGINQDCVFTFVANHSDAIKEAANVFIKVYNTPGSFLAAPVFEETSGQACFTFVDPYVVGMSVNSINKTIRYSTDKSEICVDKSSMYTVEGVTSKYRTFYGIHDGKQWIMQK